MGGALAAVTRRFDLALARAEWGNAHGAADYVILGDSTAQRLSGAAFAHGTGGSAVNLALQSGSPIVVRRLLQALTWQPRTLVIGLSPFILSDGWPSEPHEVEVADWNETARLIGGGRGALTRLSAVYRHRTSFQSWLRLHRPPAIEIMPADHHQDASGSIAVEQPALTDEVGAADARRLWTLWDAARPRAGARYQALRALAAEWQRRGYRVVYVLMPVSSPLRSLGAAGASWDFQPALLRQLIAEHGGELLDCREAVTDDGFYDADHLRAGAARDAFSRALGEQVAHAAAPNAATICPRR